MKNVISMDDYMAAKRTTESMAKIAAEFIDQNGWALKESERRTMFLVGDKSVRYGDPSHREIWQRHEAGLLCETAYLIEVMQGAKLSAWYAAMRIACLRHGIKLPLRLKYYNPDNPYII